MAAVIGALRADLSASVGQFMADLGKAATGVNGFATQVQKTARRVQASGMQMSMAITAPLVGIGVAAIRTAGNFEEAMNKVEVSTQSTGTELEKLSTLARAIGKDTVFSATEAADAIDMLAKNGTGVAEILGGAARAAVDLAAATGSQLDPAAAAVTDSMQQFKLEASLLASVVDSITGAVNESKLDFVDFQAAMGMAGGVAGSVGVSFLDFNTVLAATSANFASGSDAGTSFKTFLLALSPTTKAAANLIKQYGLSFYDAQGNLRPMADIAEQLQTKLKGLNDEARTEVLKGIFGTDAMRTAIGLMEQGGAGLDKVREKILATDAAAQSAKRMEGLNGQLRELGGALEDLAITFGNTGALSAVTGFVIKLADVIDQIGALPPVVLQIAGVIAVMVAVIGPAVLVAGAFAGAIVSIQSASLVAGAALTGLATATTALFLPAIRAIAPILAAVVLQLSVQFPAAVAMASAALVKMRLAMAFLLGPWGIAIGAIAAAVAFLVVKMSQLPKPTKEAEKATSALDAATRAYAEAAAKASSATREEAAAAKAAAAQKRQQAIATRDLAKAKLAEARATLQQILTDNQRRIDAENRTGGNRGDRPGTVNIRHGETRQAESDIKALREQIAESTKSIDEVDASIAAAEAATGGGGGGGGGGGVVGDVKGRASSAADAAERLRDGLKGLNDEITKAFDRRQLPEATVQAERMRAELEEMAAAAKKAGADTSAFMESMSALKTRIDQLEMAGLAIEAKAFALDVRDATEAVDDLSHQLTPHAREMQEIERRYRDMRERILAQIDANRALAGSNEDAARSMRTLEGQLLRLDAAYQSVTESTKALQDAETAHRNAQAGARASDIQAKIEEAVRARGDGGYETRGAGRMREIGEDLRNQQIDAEVELAALRAQHAEAVMRGDQDEANRLVGLIDLQQRLYDLVSNTTVAQLSATERMDSVLDGLADGLSGVFEGFFEDMKLDTDNLRKVLTTAIMDSLKPLTQGWGDAASAGIGKLFKMFAGGFASGGSFGPGKWAITGEAGPEIVYSGTSQMNVIPNHALGGRGAVRVLVETNDDRFNAYVDSRVDPKVASSESRSISTASKVASRSAPAIQRSQYRLGTTPR